jgi:protoporphyrinogen oxidase
MQDPVLIIGTGMAGLGAAHVIRHSGLPYLLIDKRVQPGGHTSSWQNPEGFVFDEGPHISFTTNDHVKEILEKAVNGEYVERSVAVNNYWKGRWIKHPAQVNLANVPKDLLVKILCDYVDTLSRPSESIKNYEDWLIATFGRTFAETFPMEYTRKYHTTSAANMSTDWLGPRLYKPSAEEVFRGALSAETDDVHYVTSFRYPKRGGFVKFIEPLWQGLPMRLGHKVVSIDPRAKIIRFESQSEMRYSRLISSMPLPELIACLPGVPEDVQAAAKQLACTECVAVNLGVGRADLSDYHWTYFYDQEIVFTRVSFPHMFSPGNAPSGFGSIQAEVYFSNKYRPRTKDPEEFIEPVKRDLRACGLLREDDRIVSEQAMLLPYANIIFDHDRGQCLETVHGFLREAGIEYCGRYGDWGYAWTDQSFVSGEQAGSRVLGS